MRKGVFRRSAPALVVSAIALVMSMSGVATALSDKKSDKKIAKAAAKNYFNNHIGSASVAHANTANSAGSATNAAQLGGIPASGYTRNDCNSLTGQIKGWAL